MKILYKLFIKDYDKTSDLAVRERYGSFSGVFGIICNLILFAFKLLAGILTVSISVLADAFNNLSDASSSILMLIGFKLSNKPADSEHPYGHGRIEYIISLIVSILILFVGYEFMKSSIDRIITPAEVDFGIFAIVILCASIALKFLMFLVFRDIGNRIDSVAVRSASTDSISDSLSTLAVLVGALISRFFSLQIDGYIGMLIALFILFMGFRACRETIDVLIGRPPEQELIDEVKSMVLSHGEILGVHDLIVNNYGSGRVIMSLHVEVSSSGEVLELHDVIDNIEQELREKFKCIATIHMDPIEVDDEVVNEARAMVVGLAKQIDERLSIHDFRMVRGTTHTNLIFDVVIPYSVKEDTGAIISALEAEIKKADPAYFIVVQIDRE